MKLSKTGRKIRKDKGKGKFSVSKEYLEEHYIKQGKSSRKICNELGIKSKTVILRLLKLYDIKPHEDRTGIPQPYTKKYGEIHESILWHIKYNAKNRNLVYEIDGWFLWELFLKQYRKCAISGLDLYFPKTYNMNNQRYNASLDRIDSSKGYIKDNVQWVHKKINQIKMDMDQSEFIELCKLVYNYNRNKCQ